MIENTIRISQLNDYIFCPYSIYLHNVYESSDESNYHQIPQSAGKQAHQSIDNQKYSTKKDTLMGLSVFSEKYSLIGKIDIYDKKSQKLIERKKKITHIYDGYKLQLYAQYFCMIEMGFDIKALSFYSCVDNHSYPIDLPNDAATRWFEQALSDFISFNPLQTYHNINPKKCQSCIYQPLCERSKC